MIVLNHGTLNKMTEDHNIITLIARALGYQGTAGGSDKLSFNGDGVYVTNGAGSDLLDLDHLRLKLRTSNEVESRKAILSTYTQKLDFTHKGVEDGTDVMLNVVDYVKAVDKYKQKKGHFPHNIDFVGYSRGAVTCFKMMNQEKQIAQLPEGKHFRPQYRVFAIDPVPGITTKENEHMWNDVEIPNSSTICFILLAEGERREAFTPMLPRQARMKGFKQSCDCDTMPGKHVAMSGSSDNHLTPMFTLIKDMVACFLGDYLYDPACWGPLLIKDNWSRLELYAEILAGLDGPSGFMDQGKGVAEKVMVETNAATGRRFHVPDSRLPAPQVHDSSHSADNNPTIHDKNVPFYTGKLRSSKLDKRSLLSQRGGVSRVFVNTHHKLLCQQMLPGAFEDALKHVDKGDWFIKFLTTLEELQTHYIIQARPKLYNWVSGLINNGPWKNT
jgi:hypothetical protein